MKTFHRLKDQTAILRHLVAVIKQHLQDETAFKMTQHLYKVSEQDKIILLLELSKIIIVMFAINFVLYMLWIFQWSYMRI